MKKKNKYMRSYIVRVRFSKNSVLFKKSNTNTKSKVKSLSNEKLTSAARLKSVSLYPSSLRISLMCKNGLEISVTHNAATISEPHCTSQTSIKGKDSCIQITKKNI